MKPSLKTITTVAVLSMAVSASALAAPASAKVAAPSVASTTSKLSPPSILTKLLTMSHGTVVKQFSTPLPGVDAWYVKSPAAGPNGAVVYTDGQYAFIGALLSPGGKNLTAIYTQQYAPKPDVRKVVATLEKSRHLIDLGNPKAPVHLYSFEDMNCIFCHLFYESAKPYVESGKVYIQVVPVAFLKHSSAGKAAAVLSAKNVLAAYDANENGFNEHAEEGAAKPITVTPAMAKVLARHWKLMTQGLRMDGTPGFVYQSHGKWEAYNGYSATLVGKLVREAK